MVEPLLQARKRLGDLVDDARQIVLAGLAQHAELQVLAHRQPRHDAALFGHIGQAHVEAGVRRFGEELTAIEARSSAAPRNQPHQCAQGRRLAGTVAPHQRDDLARLDAQRQALHDVTAVVPGVEGIDLKER